MGVLDATIATQPRTRGLAMGLVAVAVTIVAAASIALTRGPGQTVPANDAATQANQGYGPGYPLHGGLAGPSRVGSDQ